MKNNDNIITISNKYVKDPLKVLREAFTIYAQNNQDPISHLDKVVVTKEFSNSFKKLLKERIQKTRFIEDLSHLQFRGIPIEIK